MLAAIAIVRHEPLPDGLNPQDDEGNAFAPGSVDYNKIAVEWQIEEVLGKNCKSTYLQLQRSFHET